MMDDKTPKMTVGDLFSGVIESARLQQLRNREEIARLEGQATAQPTVRRSLALADPPGEWDRAVREVRGRGQRLSMSAVAVEMGIDRGTLKRYIDRGLIPPLPWEGLDLPR